MRDRLIQLINEDTVPCPPSSGAIGPCLLELFERVTGEAFAETPGTLLTNRVRSLSKVMGNLVREVDFNPPLVAARRRDYVSWNRCPRHAVDWVAWRRRTEAAEEFQAPPPRTRTVITSINATLAPWIRQHRYLQPTEVEFGECSMALLLLWEVEHGCSFPTQGDGSDRPAVLEGFTKRLISRVAADPELSQWLTHRSLQQPLSPGLADTHHVRWSLRICRPPPAEPQGWYDEFVSRWRAYLVTQTNPSQEPHGTSPITVDSPNSAPQEPPPHRRPRQEPLKATRRVRQRVTVPAALQPQNPAPATELMGHAGSAGEKRQLSPPWGEAPPDRPVKRKRDLRSWFQPRSSMPPTRNNSLEDHPPPSPPEVIPPTVHPEHGRASQGPPT